MTLKITINGDAFEIEGPLSVAGLIAHLSLSPQKIAIERNLEIVPKSRFEDVSVENGDRIEIVQFVGGG